MDMEFYKSATTKLILVIIAGVAGDSLTKKRYTWYKDDRTWNDAWQVCHDDGGRLAFINSVINEAFLKTKFIKDVDKEFWIGMNKENRHTGEFRWDHCEKSSFAYWKDGDPQNPDSDFCVYIEKEVLVWRTGHCKSTFHHLCEFDLGPCTYKYGEGDCNSYDDTSSYSGSTLTACERRCSEEVSGGLVCWMFKFQGGECILYFNKDPSRCSLTAEGSSFSAGVRTCFTFDTATSSHTGNDDSSNPKIDCSLYAATTPAPTTSSSTSTTAPFPTTTGIPTPTPTTSFSTDTTESAYFASNATTTSTTSSIILATSTTTTSTNSTILAISNTMTPNNYYISSSPSYAATSPTIIITIETNTKTISRDFDSSLPTSVTEIQTNVKTISPTYVSNIPTTITTSLANTDINGPADITTVPVTLSTNQPAIASTTFAIITASYSATTSSVFVASTQTTNSLTSTATVTPRITTDSASATTATALIPTATTSDGISPNNPTNSSELCPCRLCVPYKNRDDIQVLVDLLVKLLKVDRSTLSATRRKLESQRDDRPSAQAIGASGIICLLVVFSFFVLVDATRICQYLIDKRYYRKD